MTLSEKQEEEMYKTTLGTAKDITWIRTQIHDCNKSQKAQDEKISNLEGAHSLLKSKMRAFVFGLTFIASVLKNGILWGFSRLGGK